MHISETRHSRRNRAVRAGFTLVEVLLVLAIIGVIFFSIALGRLRKTIGMMA